MNTVKVAPRESDHEFPWGVFVDGKCVAGFSRERAADTYAFSLKRAIKRSKK